MIQTDFSKKQLCLRGIIVVIWIVLMGLLLERDVFITQLDLRKDIALEKAAREMYQGIYFKNQKIGYVKNQFTPRDDGTLAIDQQAHMRLNIAGGTYPIDIHLQARVNNIGQLQDFTFAFHSRFYQMEAKGKVHNQRVDFVLLTGKNRIEDSLYLAAPPLLSTSRRAYLMKQDLTVGNKVKIPWFDPISLTGRETIVEYRGREKILIRGRVHNLHHFVETFSGSRINSWLDDTGDVVKEESPAGFVFLREPEFKATKLAAKSEDLLSAVSVPILGDMPDLTALTTMRYRLSLPDGTDFAIGGDRQTWDGNVLTLDLEAILESSDMDEQCPLQEEALGATTYLQAEHPEIKNLAVAVTAGSKNKSEQVGNIAGWVFENLAKRPVLGIPDALTTLNSRQGDCNEHAALFAAMARSVHIPTRVIAGVVLHKSAFYYHAWNEVCLGGSWISLDTTSNQLPADLSHIRLLIGGMEEQMKIGALLGKLTIEPLTEKDNSP